MEHSIILQNKFKQKFHRKVDFISLLSQPKSAFDKLETEYEIVMKKNADLIEV